MSEKAHSPLRTALLVGGVLVAAATVQRFVGVDVLTPSFTKPAPVVAPTPVVTTTPAPPAVPKEQPRTDPFATAVCRDFDVLARDVARQILTSAEARAELQRMYRDGQRADPAIAPGVASNLRLLLAAYTQGDPDAARIGSERLTVACGTYRTRTGER